MNVKTWFNMIPLVLIFTLTPLISIIVPTMSIKGKYFGGGPVREYLVNHTINYVDTEYSENLVETFMKGSVSTEIYITIPIALNISWIGLIIVFCFGTSIIELNNLLSRGLYSSQRKNVKGI